MGSKEKFIEKARKIFGNKYEYDLENYKTLKSTIIIKCPYHKDIFMVAENHLKSNTGCKACSIKIRKYKPLGIEMTIFEFRKELRKRYGTIYNLDNITYTKDAKYTTIGCKKHGNVKVNIRKLINGRGCTKCKISKGEIKIMKYLDDNKIKYIHQKIFNECKNIKPLPFDFYLPSYNLLIEYDGKQHYKAVRKFGGKKAFESQKIRDEIKNKYCIENNIKLLRIKYSEFDNIKDIINNIQLKDQNIEII